MTDISSVDIEMVSIPGGEFLMGSNEYDNEEPIHRVKLSPFMIGKYPVTQAQWKAVMGGNPSHFKGDDLPVETVSWDEVNEFIKRLNQKTGLQYRLPTEAEWEYAARPGSTTEYSFGDDEEQLGDYAWYSKNSGGTTHPVGRKKPNGFGLFDMHGNVWEWCSDWYSDTYYAECQKQGTVADPTGPAAGSGRPLRGGGWNYGAVYCRSADRIDGAAGIRIDNLGFRLVCDRDLTKGDKMKLLLEKVGSMDSLEESYSFRFVKVPKGFGCEEFWMLEAPVTILEWKLVMGVENEGKMDSFPMTNVSVEDCERFARELGRRLGKDVRLPTEIEWCRALGEEPERLEEYAVFTQQEVCPVKTKKPNEYGLYDMRGLVWEPMGDENEWVWRGGSWSYYSGFARAVVRIVDCQEDRDFDFGLRVVISE